MSDELCGGDSTKKMTCSNLRPCPKLNKSKSSCSKCRRGCVSDSAPYVDCFYEIQWNGFSEREYPMRSASKYRKKCTWRFRGKHEVSQPADVTYKCYTRWIHNDKSKDYSRKCGPFERDSYAKSGRFYQCCDIDFKGPPISTYVDSGWIGKPKCAGSSNALKDWETRYGTLQGWWNRQGCAGSNEKITSTKCYSWWRDSGHRNGGGPGRQ